MIRNKFDSISPKWAKHCWCVIGSKVLFNYNLTSFESIFMQLLFDNNPEMCKTCFCHTIIYLFLVHDMKSNRPRKFVIYILLLMFMTWARRPSACFKGHLAFFRSHLDGWFIVNTCRWQLVLKSLSGLSKKCNGGQNCNSAFDFKFASYDHVY